MGLLPPLPGWDGLHPLVIHFPIALLVVAPLLVLLGLLVPERARGFAAAGFVVMALGTIAAWLAVGTGHAAGELAEKVNRLQPVIERHEELGEATRNVFTALTAIFGAILLAPALMRRPLARAASRTLGVIFLALYAGGTLLLVNTAHQGGRLVHEFGVHAIVAGPAETGADTAGVPEAEDGEEHHRD